MDLQVVWTKRALADLEVITRYVGASDQTASERLRFELLDTVEILGRFPFIGPIYEKDRKGRAREILCQRYRVFYRSFLPCNGIGRSRRDSYRLAQFP